MGNLNESDQDILREVLVYNLANIFKGHLFIKWYYILQNYDLFYVLTNYTRPHKLIALIVIVFK